MFSSPYTSIKTSLALVLLAISSTIANGQINPNQINWPTGSTGCVYAPGTNTCIVLSGSSVGDSDVTGQTASQGTVNLLGTVPAAGKYRISYYANQNALCSSGSISVLFTFTWTDASHVRGANSIALTIGVSQSTTAGSIQGVIPIYAAISTAITYTSTVTGSCATGGPASYDAHISVEAVQ